MKPKFVAGDKVVIQGVAGVYTIKSSTSEPQFNTYEYELVEVENSVVVEEYISYAYDDMGCYYKD